MKLAVTADVIKEIYYNGVVRSAKKLDRRDFVEMCRAALGSVARQYYYGERQQNGNVYHFVSSLLKPREFSIKKNNRNRNVIDIDFEKNKILRLPNGDGIVRVTPIAKDGSVEYGSDFTKAVAGSEHLYCTPKFLQDTGEKIFVWMSDEIRVHADDMPEDVEVVAVFFDESMDIPEAMVWEIINNVLGIVLKVAGFPVDPTDDGNPNVQMVQSKIASAQSIQ